MSIAFRNETQFIMCLNKPELEQFKEILARGLNTAPPEKYPDWIALSDQLRAREESEAFTPSP